EDAQPEEQDDRRDDRREDGGRDRRAHARDGTGRADRAQAPRSCKIRGSMDLRDKLGPAAAVDGSLSDLARGVVGSEILRIAAQIRAEKAKGIEICNLTVGDFDPKQFPAPAALLDGMRKALADGETNYPPSDGVVALREAVARYYGKHLGLGYPVESVLI